VQLALYDGTDRRIANRPRRHHSGQREESERPLCAACREREARYGFRDRTDDDPTVERPRTLCFDCFRMEMDRRRAAAQMLARGWNATQPDLPLAGKIEEAHRRRRRAQIAARHALGVR